MKTTTEPTANNRSINDISGDSGLNVWVQENKKLLVVGLVFVLISVLAAGAGYQYFSSKKIKQSEAAYIFTKTTLKDFQDKKISAEEVLKAVEALKTKFKDLYKQSGQQITAYQSKYAGGSPFNSDLKTSALIEKLKAVALSFFIIKMAF